MKFSCKDLYDKVVAKFPELDNRGVEVYCTLSEKEERLDGIHFHFGDNSLNWYIRTLNEKIDPEDLESAFYGILTDLHALNKPFKELEHKIRSFPSTRRYWHLLDS